MNKFRGELEIQLNGQTYQTRLTLDSIIRLEAKTGISIIELAQKLTSGTLQMGQVIQVVHAALRGGGNDLTEKETGDLVFSSGLVDGMRVCGEIIAHSLQAGDQGDQGNGVAEVAET